MNNDQFLRSRFPGSGRDQSMNLAIIGASYLQKPLITKAKEMGFTTHVFAWENGAVCRDLADHFYPISIKDVDRISMTCESLNLGGIVTIASDICSITVNEVASRLGLISNSRECTKVTTDKFLMRERLKSAGIPCPAYLRVTKDDVSGELEKLKFPLVVKPTDRSGSIGVTYIDNKKDLESAIKASSSLSLCGSTIVEEYIDGRELSVESISWKGEHYVMQYTDKDTTGVPHFIETGHHQPAELSPQEKDLIDSTVISSLDALGIEFGASHTEVKINSRGGCFVIEIGARMGGDFIGGKLVELSTGYDFVKGVINVAVGKFEKPKASIRRFAGIYYLMPQSGVLVDVEYGQSDYVVERCVLPEIGDMILPITDSGQRPAYYIYQSDHKRPFDAKELVLHMQVTAEDEQTHR